MTRRKVVITEPIDNSGIDILKRKAEARWHNLFILL